MEVSSNVLVTAIAGLLGVGVGFGGLRGIIVRNTLDLIKLETRVDSQEEEHKNKFVPKAECIVTHEAVKTALDNLDKTVKKQQHTQRRFENFALYQLTKDGMSLSDAQTVLENGGR